MDEPQDEPQDEPREDPQVEPQEEPQEEPPANPRVRLVSPEEHAVEMVDAHTALVVLAEHVAGCASVALDTEANSMHAYRERTCIMQITAGGRSAIIDVLAVQDLAPLRAALDRDDVEIVLHGGDYDITVLTRDHDFRFTHVFDTMIAATLLGDEKVGLAALVHDHFGDLLDKRFQRADWARRPLSDEHLDYLRRDTLYLPALRAHYGERLAEADLEEEAAIEFRRLSARRGKPAVLDEEGWRRIKGARGLDDRGRAVLRRLFLWREQQAEKRDQPPFKILAPSAMITMAQRTQRPPRSPRDLPGVNDRQRGRIGRHLVRAVTEGFEDVEAQRAPARHDGPRASPEEVRAAKTLRRREDALRDWRRKEAHRREVPNVVVLPNPGMLWLTRAMPSDASDIAACADIGPKRAARYGAAWVRVLDGLRE